MNCESSHIQGHAACPINWNVMDADHLEEKPPKSFTWLLRPYMTSSQHISPPPHSVHSHPHPGLLATYTMAVLLAWDSLFPNIVWLSSSLHCLNLTPQGSLFSPSYLKSNREPGPNNICVACKMVRHCPDTHKNNAKKIKCKTKQISRQEELL